MGHKGMGKGSLDGTGSTACAGTPTENSFSGMQVQEPTEVSSPSASMTNEDVRCQQQQEGVSSRTYGDAPSDVHAAGAATLASAGEATLSHEEVDLCHAVDTLMQMGLVKDTEIAKQLL